MRQDPDGERFVVKEFGSRGMEGNAEEQAKLFNQFYGKGNAGASRRG